MPTVRRFSRCRIEMYFGDHSPPHFHVITRSGEKVVFRIDSLMQWAGEADTRDTAEALEWAAEHRAELFQRWQQYSEEES